LDQNTTDSTLSQFFGQQHLKVKMTKLLRDGQGKAKGAGFVEFHTEADAKQAVNMTGHEVDGKKVLVQMAKQ